MSISARRFAVPYRTRGSSTAHSGRTNKYKATAAAVRTLEPDEAIFVELVDVPVEERRSVLRTQMRSFWIQQLQGGERQGLRMIEDGQAGGFWVYRGSSVGRAGPLEETKEAEIRSRTLVDG